MTKERKRELTKDDALSATPPKEQDHDKSSKDWRRSQMRSLSISLSRSVSLEIPQIDRDMRAHRTYIAHQQTCSREMLRTGGEIPRQRRSGSTRYRQPNRATLRINRQYHNADHPNKKN
ncbi:hypothetical protein MRX96_052356 [Rhipicephalus microplus]